METVAFNDLKHMEQCQVCDMLETNWMADPNIWVDRKFFITILNEGETPKDWGMLKVMGLPNLVANEGNAEWIASMANGWRMNRHRAGKPQGGTPAWREIVREKDF